MKTLTRLKRKILIKMINFYGPFVGAGVRTEILSEDPLSFRATMDLKWYNRNYVGTHFGGSLFAMCDPYYMLILINELGEDYVVWDKAGDINFVRPGKGKVSATFVLTREQIEEVRAQVEEHKVYRPTYEVHIVDEKNELVCKVKRTLSIRKKK